MEPWASQTALCIHPQPFPSSRDPLSVVRAEDTALGQLQLPHHHKPAVAFPRPSRARKKRVFKEEQVHFFHALGSSDDGELLEGCAEGTVHCALGNTAMPGAWHESSHGQSG